jgi:hypothetical protein
MAPTSRGSVVQVADQGQSYTLCSRTALGSARETLACLEVAVACGYAAEVDRSLSAEL